MRYSNASSPAADDGTRVVVVGAGLAGLAAAIELAEAGAAVIVLEKGEVGGEQSNFAMGWVRTTGRPVAEIALSVLNRRRFNTLLPHASEHGYGVLFCAKSEAELAGLEQWSRAAADFGVKSRLLDAGDAASRLPGCSAPPAGALVTDADTSTDPHKLVQALAARAVQLGVEIRTHCAVRSLCIHAGAARGVVTEAGEVRGAAVVLATGAWTRLMLRGARHTLPSVKVRSSLVRLRVTHGLSGAALASCAAVAGVGFRAAADGSFVVGLADNSRLEVTPDALRFAPRYLPMWWAHRGEIAPSLGRRFIDEWRAGRTAHADRISVFERERVLRPLPGNQLTLRAASRFAALFPALGEIEVIDSWAGYLDMTPDGLPVISAVERVPGLYVSAGLCGSGLGTALGAGRLIASLVTGRTPEIDVAPFRLERLARNGQSIHDG